MATGLRQGLPLLHKYVLQPQDDFKLVMAKLSYRLCVKEVSKVIHRRSLGDSISEAIKWENLDEMTSHQMVEPLVLSSKAACTVESPQLLSPDDSGYCGTMKSDDSGIAMDDSRMNFSGDQSDIMFSSTEVSPLEEDNCILNGISKSPEKQWSENLTGFQGDEQISVTIVEKQQQVNTNQVADFFHRDGEPEPAQESSTSTEEVPNSWEDLESSTEEEESEEETIEEVSEAMVVEEEDEPLQSVERSEEEQVPHQDGLSAAEEEPELLEGNLKEAENEPEPEHVEEVEVAQTDTVEDREEKGADDNTADTPGDIVMEESQEEEQEKEEEEEEGVEFVKGLRCDDVQTALQILKTHYKLSDTSVRKFIITFSSWNVSQISHPISKRCSWWDESSAFPVENPEVEDLMEDIYTRQGEISDLVDQIMEEEKLKQDLARQLELQLQPPERVVVEPDIVFTASSPSAEGPPSPPPTPEGAAPRVEPTEKDLVKGEEEDLEEDIEVFEEDTKDNTGSSKKKRRNALQRFLHAMRKRMRRSRPSSDKDRAKA